MRLSSNSRARLVVCVALGSSFCSITHAATIVVNNLGDTDVGCTLREAIRSANTNTAVGGCASGSGNDTINFSISGTITLTKAGVNEDAAATGDLDILQTVTINGLGVGSTRILGGSTSDRVFDVHSTANLVELRDLSVEDGTANIGGGIKTGSSVLGLTLKRVRVTGNDATGQGAGIFNTGILVIEDSTIENNLNKVSACAGSAGGGGVFNMGNLLIRRSAIVNNVADKSCGGGLLNVGGTVTILNSTISGNFAQLDGGGIRNSSGEVNLSFTTLVNNLGGGTSGATAGISNSATFRLRSSIVALNTTGGVRSNCNAIGAFSSLGTNLSDDPVATNTCDLNGPDDQLATNPLINPLALNLGSTLNHSLQAGSPALDKAPGCKDVDGNSVTHDQRGQPFVRPNPGGECDIGSFEDQTAIPTPTRTRTATRTPTRTATRTPTRTPTVAVTPIVTSTRTATPSATQTHTLTPTPTMTSSATATSTASATASHTASPTATPAPRPLKRRRTRRLARSHRPRRQPRLRPQRQLRV